jgi:hypothetical protein
MLLTVGPEPFIFAVITPSESAITMLKVPLIRAFVLTAIRPSEDPLTVHHPILPMPRV